MQLAHDTPHVLHSSPVDLLAEHIIGLDHRLREHLFSSPYLTYLVSPGEGKALLSHLNTLETSAFLLRTLTRGQDVEEIDRAMASLLDELEQTTHALNLVHCIPLRDMFDALFLAIDTRHKRMLDLFIETLLNLRSTWAHSISVVARSPV